MIDHGFAFNGPHWEFQDSPLQGLYFRTAIYDEVRSLDSFQPWLDMVENFPVEVIDTAWKAIPSAWLEDDGEELEQMLEALMRRRPRVPHLVSDLKKSRSSAFANWH
jgi:hypothetical protein